MNEKRYFLQKKEIFPLHVIAKISFIKMFINESVKWEQNFNAWPFVQTISTHSLTPKKSSFSLRWKALSWFDNANAKQRVCEASHFSNTSLLTRRVRIWTGGGEFFQHQMDLWMKWRQFGWTKFSATNDKSNNKMMLEMKMNREKLSSCKKSIPKKEATF